MQEQILAALKKLGPCSPGAIATELGSDSGKLGYYFAKLLESHAIKALGKSRGRRLALPDQEFGPARDKSAPPSKRKKHKKTKHAKRHKKTRAVRARTAAPTPAAERFIPTVDAERRLVIVNGGEPLIFDDAQTAAIASLLFNHYDKA